jgi:hypothetical protein
MESPLPLPWHRRQTESLLWGRQSFFFQNINSHLMGIRFHAFEMKAGHSTHAVFVPVTGNNAKQAGSFDKTLRFF